MIKCPKCGKDVSEYWKDVHICAKKRVSMEDITPEARELINKHANAYLEFGKYIAKPMKDRDGAEGASLERKCREKEQALRDYLYELEKENV